MGKIREYSTGGIFVSGMAIFMFCGSYHISKKDEDFRKSRIERDNELAKISASISCLDGERGTSFDDWAIVYDETFGYPYDPIICNPSHPSDMPIDRLKKIDTERLREKYCRE